MKTSGDSTPLVLPPALLAEVQAVADEEHRPAPDVLRDAVRRYRSDRRARHVPAYVQERARALGPGEGGEPRRHIRVVTDMSAEELEAIGNTEMDTGHNHLDAELK